MATIVQHLSVHSEDRDKGKWPNGNLFEVDLPVDYRAVSSMRLNDIEFAASLKVFTVANQNTRFAVVLEMGTLVVEITSGTYRPSQLALELMGRMNAAATALLRVPYSKFSVDYNEISQGFVFSNSTESFALDFTRADLFDGSYYSNYSTWGLGFNLGFQKSVYTATNGTEQFYWAPRTITGYLVQSDSPVEMYGDTQVYMEVFMCNSLDEIMPYTERSNDLYGSKQGGKHHSAFAKIPITGRFDHDKFVGSGFTNRYSLVTNIFRSEPPMERIQKLKFKFRYHDGRLVDFGGNEFTFTIELTLDRSDVPRFAKRDSNLRAHEQKYE